MLPDGLHFGLAEEDHHADPALGSTDHKGLLLEPVQWQFRRLSGLRADLGFADPPGAEESVEKALGRMVHVVTLEGQAAFDAKYAAQPEPPPGLLVTKGDIREALGARCTLPSGALLYDHVMEAKAHGLGPLEEDWKVEKALHMLGKQEVSARWAALMRLVNRIMDAPRKSLGGKSVRGAIFTGGMPEVTVIWIDPDTGLRFKARFDYLRIKALVDLKTFMVREGVEIVDAFVGAVFNLCYDLQAAHYLEAAQQLARLIREGRVFGDVDPAWLARVAAFDEERTWTWVTVRTTGMPEVDIQELRAPIVAGAAKQQLLEARRHFLEYSKLFGENELWIADRGVIHLEDLTFNQRITGRGQERWTARSQQSPAL